MHSFVITIDERRVTESAQRAERRSPNVGYVVEAPYLDGGGAHPLEREESAWASLVRWVRDEHRVRFVPPFDDDGGDALDLMRAEHSNVVGLAGEIVPLHDSEPVAVRDLWLDSCRIVEAADFLLRAEHEMVLVACGMAPLVIAKPQARRLGEIRSVLSSTTRKLLPDGLDDDHEGPGVELHAGDRVEVRGVVRALSETARMIDLSEWGTGYRVAPRRPERLIGDEDGTRLLIRRIDR